MIGTVTYSPEDDKLRCYFLSRQPESVLEPLKAVGFRWAGASECWFAHWSPAREDAALAATEAEGVDDEDMSLADRAAARSERFDGYSGNAERERDQRHAHVHNMAELMNGQPVLVGHHSEKRHRRDLARMSDNMRKACAADRRATYWESRAASSVAWADYKEKPGVRARRIKTLEAEARKVDRSIAQAKRCMDLATEGVPFADLIEAANDGRSGFRYDAWSKLAAVRDGSDEIKAAVAAEVAAEARASAAKSIAHAQRWTEHLAGRITYERAQLTAQGGDKLLEPKKPDRRKAALPLLNIDAPGVRRLTAAEFAQIPTDYKGTRIVNPDGSRQDYFDKTYRPGAYRVRTAMHRCESWQVFLTDKSAHEAPEADSAQGQEAKP